MSNKMNNEILLARTIQQNFLWSDKPFSMGQAWIDLLMLAEWCDKDAVCRGEVVHLKRGQVGRSILWLADRWGWSRKKVTHFLAILKAEKMATTESTTKGTIITIGNYDKYQLEGTTKSTTKVATEEQRKNTSKEIKEIKESINKENIKRKFGEFQNVYLTDEEYRKAKEKYPTLADSMIEELSIYMKSKGRQYKSHYATVLAWCRKRESNGDTRDQRTAGGTAQESTGTEESRYDEWEARRR